MACTSEVKKAGLDFGLGSGLTLDGLVGRRPGSEQGLQGVLRANHVQANLDTPRALVAAGSLDSHLCVLTGDSCSPVTPAHLSSESCASGSQPGH